MRTALSAVLAKSLVAAIVLAIPLAGYGTRTVRSSPRLEAVAKSSDAAPAPSATPVIVELFTSEGCSDCPPADRLLYQLGQTQPVPGAEVIPLEQHVDYWDRDGWRDPFSSSQFTLRQRDYVYAFNLPTAYTPQMVIDGAGQFVGSDAHHVLPAIAQAARTPKANLQIQQRADAALAPQVVHLHVSLEPFTGWSAKHGADVLLAITEDDLSSNVTAGENAGAHMNHRAVVRELRVLGRVDSAGAFSAAPDLNLV